MKIKIVGDGTVHGTRVVDAETGEPVKDVCLVSFTHRAGALPTATLEFRKVAVDLVAPLNQPQQEGL